MVSLKLILAIALPLECIQAYIQAGAFMYGCVYYAEKPTQPIKVDFQVGIGGTQCMDQNGDSASFTVTDGDVTCYRIGYVQNKPYDTGIDNCVVRDSHWEVSYSTNATQSGSTSSWWTANYHGLDYCYMELEKEVAGTNVCGSEALCTDTYHDWGYDTTPTYYLIFQPEKNNFIYSASGDKPGKDPIIKSDDTSSDVRKTPNFRQIIIE